MQIKFNVRNFCEFLNGILLSRKPILHPLYFLFYRKINHRAREKKTSLKRFSEINFIRGFKLAYGRNN